ncbi:HAMP domain-containing protein [Paenibacillus sp. LMG 31456]|uniref:histidine kinase n=1 Tax=Paenibacillus foliorum TaxID=2654974 RepID=A0A972GM24_9BACL|nr:sensor histidine kinase [Paenibacillus foliorum]NOU92510.1 HAMP domain-containing protein [Paenibacillus foliorum]
MDMMSFFKMHTLKSKIILMFILIASIVLVLQVGVFKNWISTIFMEQSDAYFRETVHQIGKRVDLQVEKSENMVQTITGNQVLKNYLKDLKYDSLNYNVAKYLITREVLRLTNLEMIDNIYIYPVKHEPISCYYSGPTLEMDLDMHNLPDSTSPNDKVERMALKTNPFQLTILLSIHDEEDRLGLLRIDLNETFLSNILDEVKLGKEGEVYIVGNNTVIFAKDRDLIAKPASVINQADGSTVKHSLYNKNWELIGIVPNTEIVNHINRFNQIFFLMVILILLAILVFALATARLIFRPLKMIMKGMESIQQGNLNIILVNNKNDEFGTIIHSFNYMADRVKSLIETIYHQQVNYRKAEILSLQAKLNPHFLYNTLDMIYWMLILKDEEEIGDSVVALSSILRYSISHNNEFVTVREDMDQLENYLKIQKMRFQEKFQYTFELQENVRELRIPKLIIQPLVENSFKYAFQDLKRSGSIVIRSYVENDQLFFEVADDGIGMSEDKIRSVFSSLEYQNKKNGIGIQLIHQRMKYIYGEGYGIATIESALEEGTKVKVKLRKKAEINAEELLSE